MDAQNAINLHVICTSALHVLQSIKTHQQMFEDTGDAQHLQMVVMLVNGIDNMHGIGTYQTFITQGDRFW